jgi:hypothetical protein
MSEHGTGRSAEALDATNRARALTRRERLLTIAAGDPFLTWRSLPLALAAVLALAILVFAPSEKPAPAALQTAFAVLLPAAFGFARLERRLHAILQLLREEQGSDGTNQAAA